MPVVERERVDARGGEALGKGKQPRIDRATEAVAKHDAGTAVVLTGEGVVLPGQVDGGAAHPAAVE